MSLEEEIHDARTEIVSDGYDMSVGEVANLYRDKELVISPNFQRLFRWDISRKTRFLESLLLGIPIPPIFVYQNEDGIWELIDGLQRLSTIFGFMGILLDADGKSVEPQALNGTHYLPSLAGKKWEPTGVDKNDGLGKTQQLQVKRARIRVEILKKESDPKAKYELFQRLNTGGARLSEQEVRNCVAIMLNEPFHNWLQTLGGNVAFLDTIDQTDQALEKQVGSEIALRFFAFRSIPYEKGLDVHEYLDTALLSIATDENFDLSTEAEAFERTFDILNEAMGEKAFKRWDGGEFKGKFLMSVFEVVATGISKNLDSIEALGVDKNGFIKQRCKDLWGDPVFQKNSGAGVRGTTRLANLIPIAEKFFRPQ